MRLIRNFHVQQTISDDIRVLCIQPSDILKYTSYPTASGGIGDVYKCIWNRGASSDDVAVKASQFPNLSDHECVRINKELDREIYIWTPLKHQYVLPLHGIVEQFGSFRALVSPWMPNGTLNSYLNTHETLSMMDRLRLLKQIAEGLQYLHDKDVIHSDLTNNNILVAADGSPRLADFAISNIMVQSKPAFEYHTGALRWVAPELLDPPEDQPILCTTKSTDIYSLGGIMLQVLYGKQPYWWLKSAIHVISAKFRHVEPIDSSIEIQPNHLDFMRRCWSMESELDLVMRCNGHGLQGKPRPNLYSGRLRLYLSRTDYDKPQDYRLRARTPATAPEPLALPVTCARSPHYSGNPQHTCVEVCHPGEGVTIA
ncbi:kinase-like domain-containing protein [Suillus subaureus]|uniref:Kinase-like domain-containing protein n=1 Tax=Suillus subaureus TaxID=48587 RepID=A0A9P7JB15_9AGAM|nr:kinase-like domain-containing protein [Suillus subaureus]KAG1811848.1 kinase-like domain-containing protein [Suillus subaureus]